MSLRDAACYTLSITPTSDPNMVELVEVANTAARGETRYVRVRESQEAETYSGVVYDAFSGAKLASMGFAGVKDKKRRLELHNPDESVGLDFTGKINFEWSFTFEGNIYRWTKEVYGKDYICALDRKPDPRVEVCLAREADKHHPGRLQILHYNLDRFTDDIKDLRGLETLLAASMLLFIDAADERSSRPLALRPTISASSSASSATAPLVPEKPVKVIGEEDFEPENPNEIVVGLKTNIDEHVAKAVGLLEDEHTLFVVVRTRIAAATQRALEVSLGVKRIRHRENLVDLHQYVVEEEPPKPSFSPSSTSPGRPGPAVINLDDPLPPAPKSPPSTSKQWAAPNITIYLSKIELPDLQPGRRETLKAKQSGERVPSVAGPARPVPTPNPARPVSPLPPQMLTRPANSTQPAPPGPPVPTRPPPPVAAPSVAHPPQHASPSPDPSGAKPGGVVSLSRLFKAAASKI